MPERMGKCPICDMIVDLSKENCSECGTDLSLFDTGTVADAPAAEEKPKGDDTLGALLSGKATPSEEKKADTPASSGTTVEDLFGEDVIKKEATPPTPEPAPTAEPEKETPAEEPVAEDKPTEADGMDIPTQVKEVLRFECPLCRTMVDEDAPTCPECGAEFADGTVEMEEALLDDGAAPPVVEVDEGGKETVTEPEIPAPEPAAAEEPVSSGPTVDDLFGDDKKETDTPKPIATKKPVAKPVAKTVPKKAAETTEAAGSPAAGKSDRELFRELAEYVGKVKPLLLGAKRIGANITSSKKFIDQAIAAGKKKDYKTAIELVKKSQDEANRTAREHVESLIVSIERVVSDAKASGTPTGSAEELLAKAKGALADNKYQEAVKTLRNVKAQVKPAKASPATRAQSTVKKIEGLIDACEGLGVDVTKARFLIGQANSTLEGGDWEKALDYAQQANEDIMKELPEHLNKVIKSAKPTLLKAKMLGVDISAPIRLIKEAKISIKSGEFMEAIRAIREYRLKMSDVLGK